MRSAHSCFSPFHPSPISQLLKFSPNLAECLISKSTEKDTSPDLNLDPLPPQIRLTYLPHVIPQYKSITCRVHRVFSKDSHDHESHIQDVTCGSLHSFIFRSFQKWEGQERYCMNTALAISRLVMFGVPLGTYVFLSPGGWLSMRVVLRSTAGVGTTTPKLYFPCKDS